VMKVGVSSTIQKQKSECNLDESKETESSESENAKLHPSQWFFHFGEKIVIAWTHIR
jgi:hypothetical protein